MSILKLRRLLGCRGGVERGAIELVTAWWETCLCFAIELEVELNLTACDCGCVSERSASPARLALRVRYRMTSKISSISAYTLLSPLSILLSTV